MTQAEFQEFIDALKAVIPFEVTNTVAHLVLEDYNFGQGHLDYQIEWIESGGYLQNITPEEIADLDYHLSGRFIDNVNVLKGIMKMMKHLPDDVCDYEEYL